MIPPGRSSSDLPSLLPATSLGPPATGGPEQRGDYAQVLKQQCFDKVYELEFGRLFVSEEGRNPTYAFGTD